MGNICNLFSDIIYTDLRGEIKFGGSGFAGRFYCTLQSAAHKFIPLMVHCMERKKEHYSEVVTLGIELPVVNIVSVH